MAKTTLAELSALKQELKDFKNELFSDIREIKEQTKKTNGQVAANFNKVAMVELKQLDCPARQYFSSGIKRSDTIKMMMAALIGALVSYLGYLIR